MPSVNELGECQHNASMSMPYQVQKITIDGQAHEVVYVERDNNGPCGIVTLTQTFWLQPVCGFKGEAVEEWPKLPPMEISALSLDEANAPRSFIAGLRQGWQHYRKRWMASTPKERGELVGPFIGHDKYGSWIRPDHKTPDLSWRSFRASWFVGRRMLVMIGMRARGLTAPDVERELARICYLAAYPDKAGTLVFLAAVEPSPHSREEAQEVRARLAESQGDSQVSKTSEPAKTEARAKTAHRITFMGAKRWQIKFGSHEPFAATDNGIGREIAYVLRNPHTSFHVLDVQHTLSIPTGSEEEMITKTALDGKLSPQSGSHRVERGKLTRDKYCRAKETLEERLNNARRRGDLLLVEEMEERLERLEQYQADAKHSEDDWAKACNDRLRAGLKRFKDAVAKDRTPGGRAFLEHLANHLTLARYRIHYHPPEGFTWED